MKTTVILLAAGQGKRMQSKIPKQYLTIEEKPVIYYAIKAFEESILDEIILVVGPGEQDYCQKEIIERYQFKKVVRIVEGGKERYHSVYQGLQAIDNTDYVWIHDGARPFIDYEMIERILKAVIKHKACVAGMPTKDTIKIVDDKKVVTSTPERSNVWQVQTPQAFEYKLIKKAYDLLFLEIAKEKQITITDDAMVVEQMLGFPIQLVEGSYKNIKITTPEDIKIAEVLV